MPNTQAIADLVTRVSVLEAEAKQYADRLHRIEEVVNDEMRKQVLELEKEVDLLRVDTALIKRVIEGVDKMADKLDAIADKQIAQDMEWNKVKAWVAGAVAVGTFFWGLAWALKEPLLHAAGQALHAFGI